VWQTIRRTTEEVHHVADDDRSRLHRIIDELADEELPIARQLLEILARGLAVPPLTTTTGSGNGHDHAIEVDDDDEDDTAADPISSTAMLARLAELTDDELLHLDELLATDREAARRFWRERFGEEMEDDEPRADGVS
jgi:hypothetical protein